MLTYCQLAQASQRCVLQIMIATTTAFLAAGRFGLAPTSNKNATAGLKLVEADNVGGKPKREFNSNDPSGFSIIDVLGKCMCAHSYCLAVMLALGRKNVLPLHA